MVKELQQLKTCQWSVSTDCRKGKVSIYFSLIVNYLGQVENRPPLFSLPVFFFPHTQKINSQISWYLRLDSEPSDCCKLCSSLLLTSIVSLKHYSLVCAIKTTYISRSLCFLLYLLASSILPPVLEESQVSLWFLPAKEFTQIAVELAQTQNSSAECSACMFGVKTATSVWAFLVQGFVKYFSSFCSGVSYLDSWFLPASKFKIIWDTRDHFTYGKPIEKNKLLWWFFFF